jgi:NRPS condensation-like uncharacterized protein
MNDAKDRKMNAIPLTPVDYVFTGNGSQPITFAFSYAYRLDPTALQKSLTQTLDTFPILQSRLVKKSENKFAYHISKEGLTLDTVESNLSFKESRNIRQYIIPVRSVESNPLTRIALTQTSEGSVLAVSISHALVDGFSYFHFFSSWARIHRGDRILNPSFQREGLSPVGGGRGAVTQKKIYDDCGLFYKNKRSQSENDGVREERLFISKDAIRSLLEEVKKEQPHVLFSENDLITASLWKKYLPLWSKGDHNPETHVTCPVDFRRVLKSIPKNYFGCAVCFASTSLDLVSVSRASLGKLALLINKSTRGINQEYVLGSLRTLEDLRIQKGPAAFEKVHVRHPEHGLIVTNLTRLPFKDLDFGSGIPSDFLIYSEVLGSAAILPAENGVEVVVLHPH